MGQHMQFFWQLWGVERKYIQQGAGTTCSKLNTGVFVCYSNITVYFHLRFLKVPRHYG